MKTTKILSILILLLAASINMSEAQNRDLSDQALIADNLQSAEIEINDNTVEPISAVKSDTTLMSTVLTIGISLVSLFIVLLYRTSQSKKIISEQNRNLSMQQEKLEKAQAELKKALQKEQSVRQDLEDANGNLKSAQSQLIHAEKMSGLGQLTAGIAHEINNPVNFIKGGMQTLKMAVQDLVEIIDGFQSLEATDENLQQKFHAQKEQADEMLTEVNEMTEQLFKDVLFGTERVTEIVNGLRIFSRHDEAKIKSADLHENLDAALMILKHKYKNKAEIMKQYDMTLDPIDCLPGQLNQVFVNLISNAVDALDGFGHIIISTQDLGKYVQISFKDNGKGIPDDIKNKIFDPFFSTKDVGEGTGLGLSISHSIIKQHKGKIEVFSGEGMGTEFTITLLKHLDISDIEPNNSGTTNNTSQNQHELAQA